VFYEDWDGEFAAFMRGKIVAVCEAISGEELGITAGSRRSEGLGFELCGDHDEDFVTFVAIDSETGHLPVDWGRRDWAAEALERKDKEIAEAEAFYKDEALAACGRLIERFGLK
jgi:hypothetical protein